MKKFTVIALCLILLIVSGCSSSSSEDEIVISDGLYSEKQIVHQMVKLLVEENTDLKVKIAEEMTPVNSYNEVVSGNCDLFFSYDGTLLTTFLHMDPSDVPEGQSLYEFTNSIAQEEDSVHLLDKIGIDNTYAVAVTQELAEKYDLNTISDLKKVDDQLVFGAEHEFFDEEGTIKYKPFIQFYGLEFGDENSIDLNLKYSAIESGNIDVTVVYATDGLNRKANLKILEDDMSFFPEYNGALLVRDDLFERFNEKAPNLEEVLNTLGGKFTNEIMTDLTYQVDVEGKSPKEVAETFLKENGML